MDEGEVNAKLIALHSSDVGFAGMLRQITTATIGIAEYLRAGSNDPDLLQAALDSLEDLDAALVRLGEFLAPGDWGELPPES